eukprot:CAMPEP_0172667812 /NCGR_PEP_ID=MMETSP1074-20121228/8665_1 /TAXON_ID=2916 /ORGANISM="Ceratium fusus, Strain PA161109" /LENGTH=669 /DNA_ID=CAMNT_0013484379 /DNA_START=57 /DNA_END=2066 /DNA_ORIENTATION=+
MARFGVFVATVAFLLSCVQSSSTTPVHQVLEMLSEMKSKGERAMGVEKKTMATYTQWVDDRSTELGFEIKTASSDVEELSAFLDKTQSTIDGLESELGKLDANIAQLEGDQKTATAQRESETNEFVTAQQDYSESVDALAAAIQVLKAQNYDRPQAEMMLQKMAIKTRGMRRVLAAFIEETGKRQPGAPEVAAYESQTGGVIEVLENLLVKFKDELKSVEEAEANAAHAYDMEMLHTGNLIKQLTADHEEKGVRKGELLGELAQAKGQLTTTKADLAEDKKMLMDTQTTFEMKKKTFESNQAIRAAELEAIAKAIDIISASDVAASYETHVKLVQVSKKPVAPHGVLLLQEGSETSAARMAARHEAASLLRNRAASLSSKLLAAVAEDVLANPFAKVITMIEELLAKLKEEAAAEADHKKWCDSELKANKLKREKHTTAVDTLAAEVEKLGSQIQTMAEELATLAKEQAALAAAMAEATADRQKEKAANEATIKDAVAAQQALKKALEILHEFYSSVAEPSLVQTKKQVPEMAAYKGMGGSSKGVIGMLEVIESDFSRLETDTRASEDQAASEYNKFMKDSKAAKETKHKREVQLKLDKDQTEFDQGQVKKDLESAQRKLDAANKYYDELKPACLEVHVSYEERVARREEEIAALRQAYEILDKKGKGA